MITRAATAADIGALKALAVETYVQAFGHSFEPPDLADHVRDKLSEAKIGRYIREDFVLVAETEDRLAGFAQLGVLEMPLENASSGDRELRRFYVHPDFQNQGVGAMLMEAVLAHPCLAGAGDLYLDVWEFNTDGRRFYERYGFEVIGELEFEVASGSDTDVDLIMVRRAPGRRHR